MHLWNSARRYGMRRPLLFEAAMAWGRARVEAARCVDVGPLFVRRRQFLQIGGFNESGVPRGEPGSVRVDCEMEAREGLRG